MYNTVTLSNSKFLGVVRWADGQQQLIAIFYATKEADALTREFCAVQNCEASDERETALVELAVALYERWPQRGQLMRAFSQRMHQGAGDVGNNEEWYMFIEDSLFRLMGLLDDDPDDWAINAHEAIQDAWLRITDGTTATVHLVNSEYYAERARMFEDALRKIGGE